MADRPLASRPREVGTFSLVWERRGCDPDRFLIPMCVHIDLQETLQPEDPGRGGAVGSLGESGGVTDLTDAT